MLVLLAAIAAACVTVLSVAAPAGAAPSCGRAVIDDWYDNGRVDGTYALNCYDEAIEILPRDVRDYSSAKEDIQRALQAASAVRTPRRRRPIRRRAAVVDAPCGSGRADRDGRNAAFDRSRRRRRRERQRGRAARSTTPTAPAPSRFRC